MERLHTDKQNKHTQCVVSHLESHRNWVFSYFIDASKVLAKPDWEPVEEFNNRDKADPKEEAADAAKAGDEVQPGHFWRSLKLCKKFIFTAKRRKNLKSASPWLNHFSETSVSEVMSSFPAILLGYLSLIGPNSWSI